MIIRALIVDDEPLAHNIIIQYAERLPDLEIIASCQDVLCAHRILQEKQIDLLFLDINMPKMTGTDFLRSIHNPPPVIFTTAYSEYALEGYELNALDYLKKPFSFDRFCQAFFKAQELILLKRTNHKYSTETESTDFLFIKSNKKNIKVRFDEILFVEGLGDYIKIQLKEQKIVANISMKKMASLLPDSLFYRIHKSYIINLNHIGSIEGNLVEIQKFKLPVGNNFRQDFFQFIKRFQAE